MQRGLHAAAQMLLVVFVQLLVNIDFVHSTRPWSYQQSLFATSAIPTYGMTPPLLVGRGFTTLISGYDPSTSEIFVHTTDDGYVKDSNPVWSQQAKLKPADNLVPTDWFGRTMVSFNQTLIVSAAGRINRRGAVYVFNGETHAFLSAKHTLRTNHTLTLFPSSPYFSLGSARHWSQIQLITAPETTEGDLFGDSLALHNDRLVIGEKHMCREVPAVMSDAS